MLKGLRKRIFHYNLNQKLQGLRVIHDVTNISAAQQVGILFEIGDPAANQKVQDWAESLRTNGRKVSLLGYLDARKPAGYYDFSHFTRRDLNWYLQPVTRLALDFIEKPFDILITLCLTECLPLEYISALSRAHFRIGPYMHDTTYCYDMMLHLAQPHGYPKLIEETMFYLQRV